MENANAMADEAADLSTPVGRAARLAALDAPHMLRLNAYCRELRDEGREAPWFDPLDGGERASILLLLERPARRGERPRFVSRDNPSPTQRNLKLSLERAGLERRTTLLWNILPWLPPPGTARNRPPRAAELAEGLDRLPTLLCRLKDLQVAVLVGRSAAKAHTAIARSVPGITVLEMPHPSPVYVNTCPTIPRRIEACLRSAGSILKRPAR